MLPDGTIVGYGDLAVEAGIWIDLRVPSGPLGEEVATALIGEFEDVATASKRPAKVRFYVPDEYGLAARLLRGRGYRVVRHSFRMLIDLDDKLATPEWPDGLRVRTFRPDADDVPVYEAQQEAFADGFEFRRQLFTEWRRQCYREPFDPSLMFVVDDGAQVAAICLCRPEFGTDRTLGWVSILGVRRPWRRRGLGRALLLHAFGELRSKGKLRVGLGVDGSNPTGAVRLYERAGMRVARRFDHYEKRLPA